MAVGKLNVLLTASSTAFSKGLAKAEKRVALFSRRSRAALNRAGKLGATSFKRIGVAGGVAAAAFTVAFKRSADTIDELAKTSRKLLGNTGATGALRGLRLAANEAGVETATLDTAMEKFLDTMGSAKKGDKQAQKYFRDIGVSMAELRNTRPEELFLKVGDAIKNLPGTDDKIAAARDLFGRSGADLVKLFNGGSAAIRQAQADIQRFGLALTAIEANKVEQMNDSLGRSRMMLGGLMEQLTVRLAPTVTAVSEKFMKWIDDMGGVGQAADRAFSFMVESTSTVLDALEDIRLKWEEISTSIQGAIAKAARWVEKVTDAGPGGKADKWARDKELERRAAMMAPDKREEFLRLARASGGFQNEGVSIGRVAQGFEEEAAEGQEKIAATERRKRTKGSLGQRFEAFVYEATETATQKAVENERKITDELDKQVKLRDELLNQQNAGLDAGFTAFGGPALSQAAKDIDAKSANQKAGGDGGAETNRLLSSIDSKLGQGVPMAYA